MKEVVFIRKNMSKWQSIQRITNTNESSVPEKLADMYLDISADLAFAQTHYPDSDILPYLNSIALKLHNKIYGSRPHRFKRILSFWKDEIPTEIYRNRKYMLISLAVFLLAMLLGVFSTIVDKDFPVQIMGASYIEMTLENIRAGKPMAVYASSDSSSMFLGITINNIMVSFNMYVVGIFTSFIPGYLLVRNGVMVGTFLTFCHQHSVLNDCLMAIWMHGVIEITSIIIAGGAGLVLGAAWMFPGSLPRMQAFRLYAKSSIKIIIGLVPLFIIAGFIESYLTRHQEAPFFIRLSLIIASLVLMAFYFVYLPYMHRNEAK